MSISASSDAASAPIIIRIQVLPDFGNEASQIVRMPVLLRRKARCHQAEPSPYHTEPTRPRRGEVCVKRAPGAFQAGATRGKLETSEQSRAWPGFGEA